MKTLFVIVLAFLAQDALCQTGQVFFPYIPQIQEHNKEPYEVPTPNQSSLGTYGIIPVSPYTGKADISIPLYSTTQRGVELNILLTYDTSGLLINQLPGWTGHNWTLNAGGVITRKINGRPDELSFVGTNAGTNIFYQYNKEYIIEELTNGNCTQFRQLYTPEYTPIRVFLEEIEGQESTNVANYNYNNSYFATVNDPNINPLLKSLHSIDNFYFNFMGISGSFYYGNDGKWKVQSDQNIYVDFDVTDTTNYIRPFETIFRGASMPSLIIQQPKTIKGFTLIDESGNKYIFGGDTTCIEYSMSLTSQNITNTTEPWNAVSWMLKEVQDRFGNTLYRFKYSRGTHIVQIQHAYSHEGKQYMGEGNPVVGYHISDKMYNATINLPVYLDSIYVADGTKIFFNHSKLYTDQAAQQVYTSPNLDGIIDNMREAAYPILKSQYQQYNPNAPYYYQFTELYRDFMNDFNLNDKSKQYVYGMNLEKLKDIRVILPDSQNSQQFSKAFIFRYDENRRLFLTSVICRSGSKNFNAYSYDLEYDRFDYLPSDYLTKAFDFWGYYNGVDYDSNSTLMEGLPSDTYLTRLNGGNNVPGVPNLNYGTMGMLTKITYPTGGYSVLEYEQNTCSSYMKEDKRDTTDLKANIPVGGLRIKSISNYDNSALIGKKTYTYNRKGSQLSSGELYYLPKFHYAWADNEWSYFINIYSSSVPLSNAVSPIVGYSNVCEMELDGSYTTYTYSNYSMEKDDMFFGSRWGSDTITPYDEFTSRQYMRGRLLEETKLKSNGDSLQHTIYSYESDVDFNRVHSDTTNCYISKNLYGSVGSRYLMYHFRPGLTSIVTKTKYGNSWVTDEITYNREHKNIAVRPDTSYADVWNVLSETRKRGSNQLRTEYRYPYHNTGVNNNLVQQFYLPATSTKHYLDNNLIDGSKTFYRNAGKIVPDYDIVFASDSTKCDTLAKYVSYSSTYRITEMLDRNHVSHKYYWNDRDQLIGAITNGSINVNGTNTDINTIMSNNSSVIYASTPTDALLYEYNNQGKMSKTVGANGMSASYDYDLFGRLTNIKDTYGSTTEHYIYNYNHRPNIQNRINLVASSSVINNKKYLHINYAFPTLTLSAEIKVFTLFTNHLLYSQVLSVDQTEGVVDFDLGDNWGNMIVYLYLDGNESHSTLIEIHHY